MDRVEQQNMAGRKAEEQGDADAKQADGRDRQDEGDQAENQFDGKQQDTSNR